MLCPPGGTQRREGGGSKRSGQVTQQPSHPRILSMVVFLPNLMPPSD